MTLSMVGDTLHFHFVLSLGVIYALFAGFYYWIGKISGYHYNEKWAFIHFWIFTLGINIIFLPMHFLGLNGLPRRYPDYADGYAGWNSVMTLGTILTVMSVLIFLYTLSNKFFINKKYVLVSYEKFLVSHN